MKKTVAAPVSRRVSRVNSAARTLAPGARYDANIDHILAAAAAVFAEKSFGTASIRDIAAHAQISFPRIYYYLRNKQEILYLISRRAFEELIRRAGSAARLAPTAQERLARFIEGHLEYHMSNLSEMKVLVREADSLSGSYQAEIQRLKREYSRACRKIVEQLAAERGAPLDRERSRILTSLLFGAMNWFYTWYEPSRDFAARTKIMDEVYRMVAGAIENRAAGAGASSMESGR